LEIAIMPAYLIGFVDASDEQRYAQDYVPPVLELINQYGGRLLCAADTIALKEGTWPKGRTVVIEFPDMQTAESWYHSEAYRPLLEMRGSFAESIVALVPGVL
jgi:uncharacterized protein (DUF1330 family)